MNDRARGECRAIHPQDLEPRDPNPGIYPDIYPDLYPDIHRDIHRNIHRDIHRDIYPNIHQEAPDRSGADTSKIRGELA